MAKRVAPRNPKKGPKQRPGPAQPKPSSPLDPQLPLVSGRWLLWSLAGIFGGGLVLVYLTLCFLFWQGQWQILFHPTHPSVSIPSGVQIEDVRFDPDSSGQPQLDGWFLAADPGSQYANRTVLYLHSMDAGSLVSAGRKLSELRQLGINVFAFDYRGFGASGMEHPSEQLAREDTEAAWRYMVETRHVPAKSIVLAGEGLGASLAADEAASHSDAGGVILDDPSPAALALLDADPRSHWMPVSLLAHDRFDPTQALAKIKQPKLFLLPEADESGAAYAEHAADPKAIVHLPTGAEGDVRQEAMRRFLDQF